MHKLILALTFISIRNLRPELFDSYSLPFVKGMEDKPSKEDELEEFIKAGRTGRRYQSIFIYVNNNKSFFVIMCDIS